MERSSSVKGSQEPRAQGSTSAAESLAANVRELRERRSLSLTRMSEMTGVSKSMLRQIELGQSSPSIATLWKIANGLRMPITSLIRTKRAEMVIGDFCDQPALTNDNAKHRVYPLVPYDAERSFEVYYVEMDPGATLDAEPHEGNVEEHWLIHQGEIEISASGRTERVHKGQYVSFGASVSHAYRTIGDEQVQATMVISYLP